METRGPRLLIMCGDPGSLNQGRSQALQAKGVCPNSFSLIAVEVVPGFPAYYQSH